MAYTRIMKLGYRHGDAAPMSIIELVDCAEPEAEESAASGGRREAGEEGKAKAPKAEKQ